MEVMQSIRAAEKVDQRIRERLGSAYEVFYESTDGNFYINAPLDEDEAENTECPTCFLIMAAEDCRDEDELYLNALHASADVGQLISALEREGLR